jgi:purine-nucleoside phosphorylase
VSQNFWEFDAGDPGDLLVGEVRKLSQGKDFDLAVVLGSGWHEATEIGHVLGAFNYSDWPCFPIGQVAGHRGQLIAIQYGTWKILFFSGRFHCYQGLNAYQAAFPVRLAKALGCPRILLTCATGGINRSYQPGDFVLVEDHVNLLGDNPLRGLDGDIFIDLAGAYRLDVYDKVMASAADDLTLHRGILAAMPGPCYETPAEIRFLASAGIDVVSMSIVPEVIMARYLNMQVAAVALVANHAAGFNQQALSHLDVLDCSSSSARFFPRLIRLFVNAWQDLMPAVSQ